MNSRLPAGFDTHRVRHWLAFGLGSGLAPRAPGTLGSLAALPFFLLWMPMSRLGFALSMLVFFLLASWICERTSRDLGVHDHGGIVIDEFLGQWLALSPLLQRSLSATSFALMLLGFVFFRFFDILKPGPIAWLDRHVHGGLGIMLDDVLAGIAAAVCLQLVLLLLP